MGNLVRVTSSGPVSGTSDSFLGGLVGVNLTLDPGLDLVLDA